MEKEKRNKAFWILGSFAIILITLINIYSYIIEEEPMSTELLVSLMGSIIGFSGGIVLFILAKNTNTVVDNLSARVETVEGSIITITEKELKEAEKSVMIYNAMMDLKEGYEARKEIDKLAKKIKRQSKRIIEEDGTFDHNTETFIIELCNEIAEIIATEYNFGLDNLDLVDFQKDLESKVEIVSNRSKGVDDVYKYQMNILFNIEKYIKRLSGVQGRENGKRRKLFDDETMLFVKLLIKNLDKHIEHEKI